METMDSAAARFCEEGGAYYANLAHVLRRPGTRILYAADDGLGVYDAESEAYMLAAHTDEAARRLVALCPDGADLFTAQGPGLERQIRARFCLTDGQSCYQAVYEKSEAPRVPAPGALIRPAREKDAAFIAAHYGAMDDEAYVAGRVRAGRMLCAEIEGAVAGFIGWHAEGAMGLLEVLPQYRRRGLAAALEAEAIRRTLARGEAPFAQILTDNAASLALQQKLGMTVLKRPFAWIF